MLDHELKTALDSITGETKTIVADLVKRLDASEKSVREQQIQLDAVDSLGHQRHVADGGAPSGMSEFKRLITENKENLASHGRIAFEVPSLLPQTKSVILSTGLTSTEPASGIQGAGRFPYRLRQLFRSVPTTLPTIGVLRSNVESLNVSPQVEGNPKTESTISFTLVQVPVQTLATYITFSKQALDDLDAFGAFINSTLVWALEKKAESEILAGDSSGVHLTGMMTAATAYDASILAAGTWNRIDVLGAAAVQLQELGYSPDFAVVSPRSWFKMISLRTTIGGYVLNDPRTATGERAYSLQIIPTPAMSGDGFLVGDSSKAVIRMREQTSVNLSFEHASNWTSNLCTALAEQRFGLQILRPDAFVTGTLASSPA